jgi:hypothetical protein
VPESALGNSKRRTGLTRRDLPEGFMAARIAADMDGS